MTGEPESDSVVEMASVSCKPGVGKGNRCRGQAAPETNEVFIREVGRWTLPLNPICQNPRDIGEEVTRPGSARDMLQCNLSIW